MRKKTRKGTVVNSIALTIACAIEVDKTNAGKVARKACPSIPWLSNRRGPIQAQKENIGAGVFQDFRVVN